MRLGRSLRHLSQVRAQVRRMNELSRVVRHELDAQGGDEVTVLELDSNAELAWQEGPSIGFTREVQA